MSNKKILEYRNLKNSDAGLGGCGCDKSGAPYSTPAERVRQVTDERSEEKRGKESAYPRGVTGSEATARGARAPMEVIPKGIILIGGPTGTGKSEIAFEIAKKINGEIISSDSRQFYREINIGTDKIPLWMRKEIPHHMIDFLSLEEDFNVFDFSGMVIEIVQEIFKRKRVPIIIGGSGLYLRSLVKGIFDLPEGSKDNQDEIRETLEKKDTSELWKELKKTDPEISKKIHPNDRRRIIRAVEVYHLTGKPMTHWQKQTSSIPLEKFGKVTYVILTRQKEILHQRIEKRIEQMFEKGWIEEVKELKERGYENLLRMKTPIGYREILDYLEKKHDIEITKNIIVKKTKQFAKKQLTWFRKEKAIWLNIENNEETINKIMEKMIDID